MNKPPQCAVVIPCFNEALEIGHVIASLPSWIACTIVLDDGSDDNTADIAESAGAEVVRLEKNSGKGVALGRGLDIALERGFTFAITMDGDGQHLASDLPRFLEAVDSGSVDLVVGNRMGNTTNMPWLRRAVNRWMSRRISSMAGRFLPDTQCGFRLIRLDRWKEVSCDSTGFEIESDMLLEFVRRGFQVEFVPIATVYKSEQSKIHPIRDTLRWFRWWRSRRRLPSENFVLAAGMHSKTSSRENVRSTS